VLLETLSWSSLVEPSISVKRNVTVPVGSSLTPSSQARVEGSV
jgi:hypothetical protein